MSVVFAYTGSEAAQQIVNWLSLGSIYALLGIGIAAVFAVLGLINFAHGEVLTISGIAMLLAGEAGWPWESFIPIAILTGGVTAVLMERIAFRPVRNAPPLTLLLTSLGLSLIIQNALQLWRGPRAESINIPNLTSATFHVGSVIIQWVDVATILTTFAALAILSGFILGGLEIFFQVTLPAQKTPFATAIVFGIAVLVLLFRPQGVLAGRGVRIERV